MNIQTETETRRVVFVEFHDKKPSVIITMNEHGSWDIWDVEWCKRDGCLYRDLAGCGCFEGPTQVSKKGSYWATNDFPVKGGEDAKRLRVLPKRYRKAILQVATGEYEAFESINESDCRYCSVCDDWLPTSDTDHPCAHIWWCDEACWWSTPDERCPAGCEDCLESGNDTVAKGHPLAEIAEGWAKLYSANYHDTHWWGYKDVIIDGYGRSAQASADALNERRWNHQAEAH